MAEILILHPGEMGAAIAASAANDNRVTWVGEGRSAATSNRGSAAGLTDLGTLDAALAHVSHVVSVCPPAAAVDTAQAVADRGFAGTYVDANAVSPVTARRVASVVTAGGATYVDGGIIGGPGRPRLYLSGERAGEAAALFGPPVEPIVLDVEGDAATSAASALKMTYAAWTKGTTAMLFAIAGAARALGVEDALRTEWNHSQPGLGDRLDLSAAAARKAWRWSPEMEEIAATLAGAGLPASFHEGAADIFARLASFKDGADITVDDVIEALLSEG